MQTGGGAKVARSRPRVWALCIALAVVALDHLTKFVIVRTIAEGESRRVFGDVLRLSHFRNPGAAFGTLQGFGGILALAGLIGVMVFLAIVVRDPDPMTAIGAGFVAGGAAGNLIDRLVRPGGVVDFIDFRFWPAFNVADSAITLGAVLILVGGLIHDRRNKTTADGVPGGPEEPTDEPARPSA